MSERAYEGFIDVDLGAVPVAELAAAARERAHKTASGIGITLADAVAQAEARERAENPGTKFDAGKPPLDLMEMEYVEEIAQVLAFGARKYAAHNWRKGIGVTRNLAAACRHLFKVMRGEDIDPESGLHHLAHAGCCLMFAWWTLKYRPQFDDRWRDGDA